MGSVRFSADDKVNLQALLHQTVLSIDVPKGNVPSGELLLHNISDIKLTCEKGKSTFLSVKSVDLAEGVEVFLVEIAISLDLRHYPGGPPIDWHPIGALTNDLRGSVIKDIRLLSAGWQVVAGDAVEGSYYGKNPLSLAYNLSDDATTYQIEDGLVLFFSNGSALTVTATGDLPGTLSLWHSRS